MQHELAERHKTNRYPPRHPNPPFRGLGLRLHGERIVTLSEILSVSADDLLGLRSAKPPNGTIKNRRLLRQVQALETLPQRDPQAVIWTIEAFLTKAG